jgi:hypothetical protein
MSSLFLEGFRTGSVQRGWCWVATRGFGGLVVGLLGHWRVLAWLPVG